MRLKTIIAPTMEEAMAKVRAEFGPDGILVSVVSEKECVRVTAALERSSAVTDTDHGANGGYNSVQTIDTFCRLFAYHTPPQATVDQLMGVVARLDDGRLSGGAAGCLNALFSIDPVDFDQRQTVMLIGPMGAGKTVSLGKIAAHYTLRGLACQVASLDYLKAGAIAQLSTYADALGLPVVPLTSLRDLEKTLKAGRLQGHITLIDTPGLNPLNPDDHDEMERLISLTGEDPILVIPAGLDALEILDFAPIYGALGCRHLIYTRADTVRRMGGLLTALGGGGFSLSHIGSGPWLGDALHPADPDLLADYLLAHLPLLPHRTPSMNRKVL